MDNDGIDIIELVRRQSEKDNYEISTVETIKAGQKGYRVAQCTLDRWYSRKIIDQRQHQAGERFRELAYATERTSGSRYDGVGAPDQYLSRTPPEALILDAMEFRLTCKALDPSLAQELVGLCCFDSVRKMTRVEKTRYIGVMRDGLDWLAARWGL